MKRLLIVVVVTALWLAPYMLAQPARPEPGARTIVARAFGDTPD